MLERGLQQQLRARLKSKNDPHSLVLLAAADDARGDFGAAKRRYAQIDAAGKASASTYNELAWLSLFVGKVTDKDLEWALKAAQLSKNKANCLHTLACVYAERGQIYEAYQILTKLLATRMLERPDDIDWWIIGRMAEYLGLREDARAAYGRVKKTTTRGSTTYELAQRGLRRVGR
jgi:tetratricopeptide (TPR) repeat protein